MHRADIVKDNFLMHHNADEAHEKIQTEKHLEQTEYRVILLNPEEAEITKTGHPHVGSDKKSYEVIDLFGSKVVI